MSVNELTHALVIRGIEVKNLLDQETITKQDVKDILFNIASTLDGVENIENMNLITKKEVKEYREKFYKVAM